MSEQLALQQVLVQRRAVDHDERLAGAQRQAVDFTRHDLLAHAALTADQDGRVGRGDAFEEVEHLAHVTGVGDDRVARCHALHVARQCIVVALECLLLECLGEHGLEFREPAWLGEEVVRALLHGADRFFHGAVGGEHHDFRRRPVLTHLGQQVEPRAVRHAHVEQHQIEALTRERAARLGQVAGLLHAVARARQFTARQGPERRLVIDEQDRTLSQSRLRHSRAGVSP